MDKELQSKNELQQQRYYLPAVKKMRLLLMIGAILYTFGLYLPIGDISNAILGFSFPALYIICGYVVLRESENIEKRILRAIGRTAICLGILAVAYFGLSLIFEPEFTLATVSTRSFWANFLLLNVWKLPIGQPIWFVQALLYAYIAIYILYKLKLLQYDIYIAAFCLVVTLFTGELAGVVGFHLFGRTYIGGNFFTRALPYILIGSFIHRKKTVLGGLKVRYYGILAGGGLALSLGEWAILTLTGKKIYTGHLLGMGVVAVAVCLFCFYARGIKMRPETLTALSRFELCIPFFVCSPIYYLLVRVLQADSDFINYFGNFAGIITLILSFLALYLYISIRYAIIIVKYRREEKKQHSSIKEAGSEKPSKQDIPE